MSNKHEAVTDMPKTTATPEKGAAKAAEAKEHADTPLTDEQFAAVSGGVMDVPKYAVKGGGA